MCICGVFAERESGSYVGMYSRVNIHAAVIDATKALVYFELRE